MWRATLSNLLAHRVRLALTTLAIVLGVAFVSGTLVYVDTARSAFDGVVGFIGADTDLTVRGVSKLDDVDDGAGGTTFGAVPLGVAPHTADRIAAVDGVAAVEPYVEGVAQVLDADGEPIGGQGPPTMGTAAPTAREATPYELRDGRYPTAGDEVAPVAAISSIAVPVTGRGGRVRTVVGGTLVAAGLGLLGVGMVNGGGMTAVIGGALALLLGASLLARYVVHRCYGSWDGRSPGWASEERSHRRTLCATRNGPRRPRRR